MDHFGFEALFVLLVLLPGFLAAWTVHSLCFRPSQTELDKIVEALLYSFVIYVAFVTIFKRVPLQIMERSSSDGSLTYAPALVSKDLLFLLVIGLVLGLLISASITNDLHMALCRKLRITDRTARPTIWNDVFHDHSGYVQVQFADGREIIGEILYFSDSPEEASLFLGNAAWIDEDEKAIEIPGPGILITKNMPIETIMFLDDTDPAA